MKLKGENLGERQHDFNTKVNKAISQKINFAAIRDEPVDTDIDQLFKVDIASRLKDVPFLLQTLVSGDSLYITRGLKSVWLFDDEYQLVMNPDYLSKDIFPHMSSKMMKKILTTASTSIKNEQRAENFYLYCKENSMDNIAVKFLVSTSEAFKETVLLDDFKMVKNINKEIIKFIIGSSFKLADVYRSQMSDIFIDSNRVLYDLRFLYSINSGKYLDMLEAYYDKRLFFRRFGLRISKDIFKSHKERILKHPQIYVEVLNENIIAKFSSSEDAKLILRVMFLNCNEFWYNFMGHFEFVINIIPLGERYEFLKELDGNSIEMCREWYNFGYYKHMTEAQQEKWALDQLASKKEILGAGQDFLWYELVRFDLAFEEVKKLILITKQDDKRIEMLCVLVKCTKNQTELEKLLIYFYTRHINEIESSKNKFVDCVNVNHNVFSFHKNCWKAFNKILYSLDVYNEQKMCFKVEYKMITLFYHILHGHALPEVLNCFILTPVARTKFSEQLQSLYKRGSLYDMELKIRQYAQSGMETIYEYILKVYLKELMNYEKQEYNNALKMKAGVVIKFVERLRSILHKKEELPEIVAKFKKLDAQTFKEYKKITPQELMRMLKKNASHVADFDLLERNIEYELKFKIKGVLQKLNIYFHDDIAQQYLEYFKKAYLKDHCRVIYASVHGILVFANEKFKKEFILKYAPEDAKVHHDEIDRNLLYIREAICRFACYSRPPIDINSISQYIKGDYLQYCIPMFNVYMTRYPPAIREKFVKLLLNKPVSIQKHGIRLAIQCFKINEWIDLILNSWKKYQNVSLRMVIYEYVFRSVKECEATRREMFEVLKKITHDLKEDECEGVMEIARHCIDFSRELKGSYLNALWTAISQFSESKSNIKAKASILCNMAVNVEKIPNETVKKIIIGYVDGKVVKSKIIPDTEIIMYNEVLQTGATCVRTYWIDCDDYDVAAWNLAYSFICFSRKPLKPVQQAIDCEPVMSHGRNVVCEYCWNEYISELVKYIIQKCVEKWNNAHFDRKWNYEVYVFERFCTDFIYRVNTGRCVHVSDELEGLYLDLVWPAISKFSDCKSNVVPKVIIINRMAANLNYVLKETVKTIVTGHVENMLVKNKIVPCKEGKNYEDYDEAVWELSHAFICRYCKDEDILELVKFIMQKCVEKWNDAHFDYSCNEYVYVFQRFCSDFINSLRKESYSCDNIYHEFNSILEAVLKYLTESIPKYDFFILMLNLKVVILTNKVLEYRRVTYKNSEIGGKEMHDISKKYITELENLVNELIQNKLFSLPFINVLGDVIVSNLVDNDLLIFIAPLLASSSSPELVLLSETVMPYLMSPYDKKFKNQYKNLLKKIGNVDVHLQYLINIKNVENEFFVEEETIEWY